ncbi:manganese efflux pump MntP [Arenibaculum pallidiluteum]|uniref:manganese efflux pump MntP n=1 Tax=Arenibaculum pallidiluteum TaxID=2812559 RepID=UPI001A973622|nr:manganese efflux pump MntP [Arenibaculum pallidiluteum]
MNMAATAVLAFGMSMDAFAASVGKGAALHRPRLTEALRTGMVFGAIETATPVLGWALGAAASEHVADWDHWLAFVLLLALGGRMIHAGTRRTSDEAPTRSRHPLGLLIATAIGTSLDALAAGAGLGLLGVDIIHTAAAIGIATLLMATCGVLIGRFVGPLMGRRAEIAGGLVLIGMGTQILVQHLAA